MIDWLLGVLAGALFGLAAASASSAAFHRRMAEGWHYLSIVLQRRPIDAGDPMIAFGDDPRTVAYRRAVIADHERSEP